MNLIEKYAIKQGTIKYWNEFFNTLQKNSIIKKFEKRNEIIYEVFTNYNKKIRILCLFEYIFSEYRLKEILEDFDLEGINLINIGSIATLTSDDLLNIAEENKIGLTRERYLKRVLKSIDFINKANFLMKVEMKNEE